MTEIARGSPSGKATTKTVIALTSPLQMSMTNAMSNPRVSSLITFTRVKITIAMKITIATARPSLPML